MNGIKCPKGERLWVKYYNHKNDLMFILTSKEGNRDFYFLYELVDGDYKKLGKAHSPLEIEEKHNVSNRIRGAGRE